jgi:hypothetical protein
MSPEKQPLGGELGGIAIADILEAFARSAEFLAGELRQLEARAGREISAQKEKTTLPDVRPGDDLRVEISRRGRGSQIFRRVAFVSKMIGGKRHEFGQWEAPCMQCGRPFFVETWAGVASPKSKAFQTTACKDHRRAKGGKYRIAPIVVSNGHG